MICYTPPPHYIWRLAMVSSYCIITQPRELIFAALLPIEPVRMLDCSAFAFVSRLSDVKQLDGPSGHLLVSQKLESVSSFVCVKTVESHFLHNQPLNAAEGSSLVRQITVPGCFSNQSSCLPCLNTHFCILTSSLTNDPLGYKISHPFCGVLCSPDWMLRVSTVEHMDWFRRIIAGVRLGFLLSSLNIIIRTRSLWKPFFNASDSRSAFSPQ